MSNNFRMTMKVQVDDLHRITKGLSSAADRAHNSALGRATKKFEKELVDRAAEKINLKKGELKDSLSVNAKFGRIEISGASISLRAFLPKQEPKTDRRAKGLKIKLWKDKGKITYQGSFAAYGGGGNLQVFKRSGPDRLPLKKLHGKGIRDMWEAPAYSEGIIEIAQQEYSSRFISSFDHFKKNI